MLLFCFLLLWSHAMDRTIKPNFFYFYLRYTERGYYWIVSAWGPVSFNLGANEKSVQLANANRGEFKEEGVDWVARKQNRKN